MLLGVPVAFAILSAGMTYLAATGASIHCHAVDNHRNAGRNDGSQRTGCGHQARAGLVKIAVLLLKKEDETE